MKQYGTIESIRDSRYEATVHIDPFNSRVRLLDYGGDAAEIAEKLGVIALHSGFGKIICMAYEEDLEIFSAAGFTEEGRIPGYFRGRTAHCLARFTDPRRALSRSGR